MTSTLSGDQNYGKREQADMVETRTRLKLKIKTKESINRCCYRGKDAVTAWKQEDNKDGGMCV